MVEIIPAILPDSELDLLRKAESVRNAPILHIDVLENDVWSDLGRDIEVHLMVENPEEIIERWLERKARRVIVHKINERIISYRAEAEIGLAIEFIRPLDEITEEARRVDFVSLMSIRDIGAQGRPFESKIFDRIRELRRILPETITAIDGGINLENADDLIYEGADRLIVGSSIFRDENPDYAYKQFVNLTL